MAEDRPLEERSEAPEPSDAILFVLVCFAIGIFIRRCLKWTKIPYTAMLLVSRCQSRWFMSQQQPTHTAPRRMLV
jgi:hypothetical protein